ncbi:MAG: ATP-binding cassette domain-containing protein [Gammaproteobacteria bacterium]|nr:ATP-binding cassette domain-containing protein [Gammaproteobacteria bacterium]
MLSLNQIACRRDGKVLFERASLVIHKGQKVGLTGANGTGKSSLFAMITNTLDADEGELTLPADTVIGHVAQESAASSKPAIDFVLDGDSHLRELERLIQQDEAQTDGLTHARRLADYEQAGGYQAKSKAGGLMHGLGFSVTQQDEPVSTFSGGWRMRLNLAQALMQPSDLLLLDEPTNHLDLDAVLWLEQWLRQFAGTLLLISHDREFLDAVTNHTLHIEHQKLTLYTGNYSAFESIRAAQLANEQAVFARQEKKREAMQRFVDRFRAKATKARQAQSRIKMLERMTLSAPAHVDSSFEFEFAASKDLPNPLLSIKDARIGYGDVTVLKRINLSVQAGDRIGLLGANGAGKSTLIKAMVGELTPLDGERVPAQKLKVGYFAQHQVDQLRLDRTAIQALQGIDSNLGEALARDYLGKFGYRGDQALQLVSTFSGGERARLALALIVYQQPNLLLLDEPTNHLDISMRQALSEALQSFDGALLVVSHDRSVLKATVDDLWLLSDGYVAPFTDDLDGYARWLSEHRRRQSDIHTPSVTEQQAKPDRKEQKRHEAARRAKISPLRKIVDTHSKSLEKAEARLCGVRDRLSANDLYNAENKEKLAQLLRDEADHKKAVEHLEEELLDAMQALEQVEKQMRSSEP